MGNVFRSEASFPVTKPKFFIFFSTFIQNSNSITQNEKQMNYEDDNQFLNSIINRFI